MKNYTATEQAYKNGYEKGYEDAKKDAEEEFILRMADLNVKVEEDKLELLRIIANLADKLKSQNNEER